MFSFKLCDRFCWMSYCITVCVDGCCLYDACFPSSYATDSVGCHIVLLFVLMAVVCMMHVFLQAMRLILLDVILSYCLC